MKTHFKKLQLLTKKQFELTDITSHIINCVIESGIQEGVIVATTPHTTASIKINHNEPLLIQDFMKTLYKIVPLDVSYSHDLFEVRSNVAPNERSNGHAHVKSFLLGSSESLVIHKGDLALGAKQSVFFVELDGGRDREVWLRVIGE